LTCFLRQSTAQDVSIGPFLDETDGKTAETGLTITQPDIRIKKNGGAWAQKNAAQTLSHEENGWYEIALDATDTNTLGQLLVAVHEAGALPCWREFMVLPAAVYDSLVAGTDNLQVDAVQLLGSAFATPSVAGVPEVDITHHRGTAVAVPSVAGVPEVDVTHVAGAAQASIATQASVNTIDDFLDTEIASIIATLATIDGRLDTEIPAILAAVDTEVAAIKAKTDNLPADPASETSIAALPTAAENATELLDQAAGVETGLTVRQALRVIFAAMAGKLSGAATTTVAIRNLADTLDRISATVDADGNRSAVTLDLT
jgi:hypothetical protein